MPYLNQNNIEVLNAMLTAKKHINPQKKKLVVAIYARKSTEDIHQTSIDTQIRCCKDLINSNKELLSLTENHIYTDDGKSGMHMDNRTGLQALLKEAEKRKIDVVVVCYHDRLTRKVGDFAQLKDTFKKLDIFLLFGNLNVEQSAAGNLTENIFFSLAQFQAEDSAEKTANVLRKNVERGDSAGGAAPYGLRRVGKKFDIEPSEAPAVKLMFERTEKGDSYEVIKKTLTELGYKTRAGQNFTESTISYMLRNWKYTGIYVYCRKGKDGKPLNQKKYRTLVKEQPEMRNMGTVLNAIVSQDLFDKVQKIVDERELKCPKQNRHAEYLLSGLVHCECGKNMYGETSKSANKTYQYRYYVCPNQRNKEGCKTQKINADYLEQAIKELLLREINTYLQQNKIDKKQLETIRDKFSSLLGELNRNISTLERSNAKYLNCITEANKLMVTEYEKKITDNLSAITCLNTKAQQTKETITAIQQVIDGQVTLKFTPEQLFSDTAITRQLIRAFIDNITIKENGQIIINLK